MIMKSSVWGVLRYDEGTTGLGVIGRFWLIWIGVIVGKRALAFS